MATGGFALLDGSTGTVQSSHMPSGTTSTIVRKTAGQSVASSTVLVNDTHFSFAVAANDIWVVDAYADITMGVTGQIKVAMTVPSGATLNLDGLLAGAGTAAYGNTQTSGTAIALVTVLTAGILHVHACIVNSTNAGTVQLQWAQNSSDVTNTTLLINSFMIAHKI